MTPQRLAEGMLAHGIGEIENDGFETLLVGPLHLTNRSIHVLERHQRGADEFTAIFSHDLQYREVVRARHRGRQLRLDRVGINHRTIIAANQTQRAFGEQRPRILSFAQGTEPMDAV